MICYQVLLESLRALNGVDICVADGEADPVIASLGFQKNCPVVSDDSDLLLFDLTAGVILMSELVKVIDEG